MICYSGGNTEPENLNPMEEFDREMFLRRARIFQTLMASGDTLQGSYATLYAVGRGATGVVQGAIVSIRELGTAILQPLWGSLSDLRGRRLFVALGMIIQAICWGLLMPLANKATVVLAILILQTLFGYMVIPSWNGWLGDFTTRASRGRLLGRLGIIATWIAAVVLFIVSSYMQVVDPSRNSVDTFSIAFRVAGVFFLTAAIMTIFLPQAERFKRPARRLRKIQSKQNPPSERFLTSMYHELHTLTPDFQRFLLVEAIFRLAWSAAWPIFPYATLSATNGWLQLAILQMAMAFASGLSQLIGGRLSDRIGRKMIILTSRSILVAPPILFALGTLFNNPLYLLVSNILTGVMFGAGLISINSLILDLSPLGKEGTYFSIYMMIGGIMAFIGSMTTGLVLNFIVPNDAPSSGLIATILFVIAGIRFIAWFAYFYLPNK